jgi:hypothetical protein
MLGAQWTLAIGVVGMLSGAIWLIIGQKGFAEKNPVMEAGAGRS